MIKHNYCGTEFKAALEVEFVAFVCKSEIIFDFQRNTLHVKSPFYAEQLYNNPQDLTDNELCQTRIFCPKCSEWYPISRFEFYNKCQKCGKTHIKTGKVFCRRTTDGFLIGCYKCIKAYCTITCGAQRGLCETYRDVLYKIEHDQQRGR